mgnify:CR=1 FL=1|jgi:DUF4097 and DUF4098 domain-containing protein YvlB
MLLLFSLSVSSQSFTKENKLVRSFGLTDETETVITNKYGDITLENWDKDSIRIEISYKVTSTKESKLDKTFDAINFDFKANQYYVVASTVFEGKGSFWTDVSDIASNLFTGGTNTTIDYTIYIPEDKHISLNLKYGNVYITNHVGYFKLSLSNGDFKAHNLTGDTELDIEFGDATVNKIIDGSVKVRYGTFNLENANKILLVGQSAEFYLGEIDELTIDSKRDKISLEYVGVLSGQTYFSRVVVDEIEDRLDLSTKYGSFKLNEIGAHVKNVKLTSYNTSVNLYFRKAYNYYINLISDDKAEITYSATLGDFTTKKLPGKEKLKQAECVIGERTKAIPITIDIKSGLLTLKIKD